MFGTFGYAWGDTASGNGCLVYPRADKSGYNMAGDCVLKPWDDASFHHVEESNKIDGVYGPNEDIYFFKNQTETLGDKNAVWTYLATANGKTAVIMFGTFGTAWHDDASGKSCLIYLNRGATGYVIPDDC